LIELFANTLLLVFLLPKPIAKAFGSCFTCCGRQDDDTEQQAQSLRSRLFYENIVNLDDEAYHDYNNYYTEHTGYESDATQEETLIIKPNTGKKVVSPYDSNPSRTGRRIL